MLQIIFQKDCLNRKEYSVHNTKGKEREKKGGGIDEQ